MRSRNQYMQSSFVSSEDQFSTYCVESEIKQIKYPYLEKVEEAKKRLQTMKRCFEQQNFRQSSPSERTIANTQNLESRNSQQTMNSTRMPERLFTDLSNDQNNDELKKIKMSLTEWKLRKETTFFNKKNQLQDKFHAVFEKKTIQPHNWSGDTFKLAQKQLIQRIFFEIGDVENVTFEAIQSFFEGCPLFYQIYNIHPNSLSGVLAEAAHHYETRLTQQEFMNLFLINNRSMDDFNSFGEIQQGRRCVLGEQSWKEMKQIFDALDTFGQSKITLNSFLRRLKALTNKHLLSQPCLFFPPVTRFYNLSKIVNELEQKSNLVNSSLSWEELTMLINNFEHINDPTIDILAQRSISTAKISKSTNIFMLKQEALQFLKQIFARSPKYCQYFVQMSHFCEDIYEACEFKQFEREIVRNNINIVTFAQAVGTLRACKLKFMDLDEVLEWFAIKQTFIDQPAQSNQQEVDDSSEDQNEIVNKKVSKLPKKPKNFHPKYSGIKYESRELTKVEQFCLSKKRQTIRQRRLKQMLDEREAQERKQCSIKFKANSIPSSTNQEKYLQYKQKMYKKKQAILSALQKQNQRQNFVIQYLSANTKLFEKKKVVEEQNIQVTPFEPKPVPWFVHPNLLAQIQAQKRERQYIERRKNHLKYLRQWKNLPNFLQQMNMESQINIGKSPSKIMCDERIKSRAVPDFNELHRRFELQLQKKKQFFQPTLIKQFNITSPKSKTNVEPVKPSPIPSYNKNIHVQQSNNFIGSTLKYQASVRLRQQKKQRDEERIHIEKKTKKERKRAQRQFANYMRLQLKKQAQINLSTSKIRQKSSISQKQYKKQMAQLYRRVFSRPFLFQSNSLKSHADYSSKAKRVHLGQTISDMQWQQQLSTPTNPHQQNNAVQSTRKCS